MISEKPGSAATCCIIQGLNVSPIVSTCRFHPAGDRLLADSTGNSKTLRAVATSGHVVSLTTPSAFANESALAPDAATTGQLNHSSPQQNMTDDHAMLWPGRIAVTTGGAIGSLAVEGRAAQWQSIGVGSSPVTLGSATDALLPLTVLSPAGWHRVDATGIVQPATGAAATDRASCSERPGGRSNDVTRGYTVADAPSVRSAVTIAGGQQRVRSESAVRASPLGLDAPQSPAAMGACRTFTIGRMGSLPWVVPASPPRCVLPQSTAPSPTGGATFVLASARPSDVAADRGRDVDSRRQLLQSDDCDGAFASRISSPAGGGGLGPRAAAPRRTGYAPLARLQPNVRFPAGARIVHPLQDHDYCYDVYCKLVVSSAKSLAPVRVRPRKHPRKGPSFGGVGRPCLSASAAAQGSGGAAIDRQLGGLLDKCVPRLKRKYERRKSVPVSTAPTAACLQAVSTGNEDQTSCEQLKQPDDVASSGRDLMSQYKIPSSRSSQLRKPSLRDEYVYFGGTKLKSRTRNLDRKENEEPPLQPFYSSHAFYWSGLPAAATSTPPPVVSRSEKDGISDDGGSSSCRADAVAASAIDSTLSRFDATSAASRSEPLDFASGQLDPTPKECVGALHNAAETLDIGVVLPALGIGEYDGQFIDADITVDDVDLTASAAGSAPALEMVAASGATYAAAGAVAAAAASIGDLLSSMTEAEIKQVVQALGDNLETCCNNEVTLPFGLPPDGRDLGVGNLPALDLNSAAEPPRPCDPAVSGRPADAVLRVGSTDFSAGAGPDIVLGLQQPPTEEPLRLRASADSVLSAENGCVANSTHTPQVVPLQMFWNTFPALQIDGKRYVRLVDIHRQALPSKDTGLLKRRAAALGFAVDNCSEMQRNLLVRYAFASPSRSTLIVDDRAAEAVIASYLEPQGLRAMSAASGASKRTSADTDVPQLQASDRPREATASTSATVRSPNGPPTASAIGLQALPPGVILPDSGRRPCIVAVMPKRGRPPIRRTEQQQRQQTAVDAPAVPPATAPAQRPVRREPSPTRVKAAQAMANSRRRMSVAAGASRRRASALLLRKQRRPSLDGAEHGTSTAQVQADDAGVADTCPPARSQRLRQVKTCYRRFLNLRHSVDGVDTAGDELSDRGYQSGDSSPIFVPSSAPTPCSAATEEPLTEPAAVGNRCPTATAAHRLSTVVHATSKDRVPSELRRYVELQCSCHLNTSGFVHKGRLDVELCHAGDPRCIQCALCKLHMTASIFALHRHTPLRGGIDGTSDTFVSQAAPCRLEEMRLWPASSDAAVIWRELVQCRPSAAAEDATDASCATSGASRRSSRIHKDKQLHPIEAYEYEWSKRRRTSSSSDTGVASVAAGCHGAGVAALEKCAVGAGTLQRIKPAQSESALKLPGRRPRSRR